MGMSQVIGYPNLFSILVGLKSSPPKRAAAKVATSSGRRWTSPGTRWSTGCKHGTSRSQKPSGNSTWLGKSAINMYSDEKIIEQNGDLHCIVWLLDLKLRLTNEYGRTKTRVGSSKNPTGNQVLDHVNLGLTHPDSSYKHLGSQSKFVFMALQEW